MIKQTEHFKNFNFNCFTYGNTQANCETIYITLLVPFTFWILKTNMGSVCLQDYVLADSQCILLIIHASTAGCLLSWFMFRLGFYSCQCVITTLVTIFMHTTWLFFGVWLHSKVLQIMYYWFSVVSLSFFLFFHLDQILDYLWINRTYLRPLVWIFLFMDN